MITAICIALGLGLVVGMSVPGGVDAMAENIDAWADAVTHEIKDDAREDEAKKVIADSRKTLDQMRSEAKKALGDFFAVDEKYEATAEDYMPAIAALDRIWAGADKQFLDQRFKIRAIATEQEWPKCLERVNKAMQKAEKKSDKEAQKGEKTHAKDVKKVEKAEKAQKD